LRPLACKTGSSSLVLYNYIKSASLRFLSRRVVSYLLPSEVLSSFLSFGSVASQLAGDFSVNLLNLFNLALEHHACDLLFVQLSLQTLDVGLLGELRLRARDDRLGVSSAGLELRCDLILSFFGLLGGLSDLLLLSLELIVHVASDGAFDLVEAFEFVSGDDGLFLFVLSGFVQSHGGRVVSFSLEATSSAQDSGLNSGNARLSAHEVTVALGLRVAKVVLGKSSRSLLLLGRVFKLFIEAFTDSLTKSIDTTRSTGSLTSGLVRDAAGGRSGVPYSVEILLRVVGLSGGRSAMTRSALSTLRTADVSTASARDFISANLASTAAEGVDLIVVDHVLLSEHGVAESFLNVGPSTEGVAMLVAAVEDISLRSSLLGLLLLL